MNMKTTAARHSSMVGHLWCDGSLDQSLMMDSLSYFSFQPVFHSWYNQDHGMYYPVYGIVNIKDPCC